MNYLYDYTNSVNPSLASYFMKPSDALRTLQKGGITGLTSALGEKKDSFMKGVPDNLGDQMGKMLENQVKFDNQNDVDRHMDNLKEAVGAEGPLGVMKTITDTFSFFSDPNWRRHPKIVERLREGERLQKLDEVMDNLRGVENKDDL